MVGHSAARRAAVWLGICLSVPSLVRAAGEWQVPDAPLRYKLDLAGKPTHPTAGYYVHLPDGGILRGTSPATVVMTDDGKVLASYLLWHNPESGFSIVFADPGAAAKSVYVYAQAGRPPQVWRPETGLTPSSILCTLPGRESLPAAHALGKLGRVEPDVHSSNLAGIPKAPFSIGGDQTGRPRPGSFYLLSYVEAAVAGSYWIAPFILNGQCEVHIDGTKLNPKERSKAWGGTGASVELTQGLHRVEVFQSAGGTGAYSSNPNDGGLMYLTWRPPKEELKQVESRVLSTSEIARSGSCNLTAVQAKDGAPVAVAIVKPSLCYWFEYEEPLIIYELSALNAGQPAGTTWTWSFPEGASVEGARIQWLFPGLRENKLKLTVKSGQSTSVCTASFFGFGTQQTSLENSGHRDAFRKALATMLKAYPRSPDPVAAWGEAWWNNLLRTVEAGEGYALLLPLFTDHLDAARKKLTPAQLFSLQDIFLDLTQRQNPKETLQWLQKFQSDATAVARQSELKLREGELLMYYLGDRKVAEKIFTALAVLPGEPGERAKIRLGDLALLGGDLNKATSFYADVQSRARTRRNAAPAGGLVADQLIQSGTARPAASDSRSSPFSSKTDQKRGALQEVSLTENVRTLADGGFLLEARQAILTWEIEFPLSKISGDFILRESGLYIRMEDWKRAQPMLEAYCREIDASSYLPDAASMLITCVRNTKQPPASIRDLIEKVKGRLKYHPVAEELDRFLATAPKPNP